VIDSNTIDLKLIGNVFNESKKENINVILIDNEIEATAYLKKIIDTKTGTSLDFIILDIKLLEFDGSKLLSLIKTNEETKEIPVLVFSNSNLQQDINTSYRLHANCFLQKPVALKDYVSTILSVKNFWMNSEVVSLPSKF